MKKICIINGHPSKDSYNYALAESYKSGASQANASVNVIHIGSLDFNPNLGLGYKKRNKPLEPDLLEAIEKIKNADHLVWFFPMWWYGYPAIMKGFIDRAFLPNIAFRYTGKPFPEQLFKGKTARIIVTADSPAWYTKWIMRNPAINQLKYGTLRFCGIKPVKVSYIGPMKNSKSEFKNAWLNKVNQLGLETK
ncbi:NAD(P)H-dependent oxidoreductase [uncultured Arcticibacterium sp.]|uniref:NAD(P)H-dependent oxidoreductase n=1 Tax=uncultured Arcticibacterium sp. TaxID=2173042 RepID=UPI0030F6159A